MKEQIEAEMAALRERAKAASLEMTLYAEDLAKTIEVNPKDYYGLKRRAMALNNTTTKLMWIAAQLNILSEYGGK